MTYVMLSLVAVFAIVTIVAIGVLGYAFQRMSDLTGRSIASLAQVKGLERHAADPQTFEPSGRSWEAAEKDRVEVVNIGRERNRQHRRMELEHAVRYHKMAGNREREKALQAELDEMESVG